MTALNNRYPAIEGETEFENEAEWESEFDEFSPAAESEVEQEFEAEQEFEFEFEREAEQESEAEFEDELEAEYEEEAEGFVNPVRRIYRDAELMAHLANAASQAEHEEEAEAFIGALIPLASKLIPRAASLISRNAPTLIRAATRIGRQLRRSPSTRRLIRTMPVILQRTAQSLADQTANGADVGADDVLDTLSDIAGRVLAPDGRRRAMRAVGVFDRRYHRRSRWQRGRVPATRATRRRYAAAAGRPMQGARRGRRY